MAEREVAQQEEKDAKANLPWYTRDYEADEMNLMSDTELNQLLDDFYGESAEKLSGKAPEKASPVERYRHKFQTGLLEKHAVSFEETIPYDSQTVCKSLDPRLYRKHPFGCGCNQGSHSSLVKIVNGHNTSTAEAHSYPRSCLTYLHDRDSQDRSSAVIPPSNTEPDKKKGSARLELNLEKEETERNEKISSAAPPVNSETAEDPATPKPEASSEIDQSSVPYEPEKNFNIRDWVHDQL